MRVLINFYSCRYVKSRSDAQLLDANATETSACKPEQTLGGNPIVPCGLIAWSLFNDTYNLTTGGEQLSINKKDISWKSDREHKFGKNVYPQNFPNNLNPSENGTLIGGASLDPTIPVCFLKWKFVFSWKLFLGQCLMLVEIKTERLLNDLLNGIRCYDIIQESLLSPNYVVCTKHTNHDIRSNLSRTFLRQA